MAVVIPNSTETTGGNPFASLDQAEPDALDFEIVGATGVNGVLSGCEVISKGTASTVEVSSGNVVIGGITYDYAGDGTLSLPTAPTDSRFDIVVIRKAVSGSTATAVVVEGTESATNPVFPPSTSVNGAGQIDFATDVVVAAVLREGGATITVKQIVDKRPMLSSTVLWQGASLPAGPVAGGTLFHLRGTPDSGFTNLYVRAGGSWIPVGQGSGVGTVPIGMSMTWNGASVPSGFLLEDGSDVSRSTYSALFAVLGTTYGAGDGSTTFTLPNRIGKYTKGSATRNQTGGGTSYTVTTSNLPGHTHSVGSHNHTMSHTHSVGSHSHSVTVTGGSHSHGYDSADHRVLGFPSYNAPLLTTVYRLVVGVPGSTSGGSDDTGSSGTTYGTSSETHSHSGTTGSAGASTTGGASNVTTTSAGGTTGSAGSGNPLTIEPPFITGIPVIKAA